MGTKTIQGNNQLYEFSAGVGIFVRDDTRVQFGLDATRAGVIEVGNAPALAQALRALDMPISQETFISSTGLGKNASQVLFEELLDYGILRPRQPAHQVFVIGQSRLAQEITRLLHLSGIVARAPFGKEHELTYLSTIDSESPVVLVDRVDQSHVYSPVLKHHVKTWIPVSLVDSRGFVGPVHIKGKGPCPLCLELHRTDTDPRWNEVVRQGGHDGIARDPEVVATVAAHVITMLRTLLRIGAPPGSRKPHLLAGEMVDVDIYGKTISTVVTTHHRCPVCCTPGGYSHKSRRPLSASIPLPLDPDQTAELDGAELAQSPAFVTTAGDRLAKPARRGIQAKLPESLNPES